MRLLTIPLAIAIGFGLAIGCDAEPEPNDDLGFRAAGISAQKYCQSDANCAPGTVCEPSGPFCNVNESTCVAGCHEDDDCGGGEFCQQLDCFTCPCPGECMPDGGEGCTDDDDCAAGTVCEPAGPPCDLDNTACIPGCHADDDCSAGEVCDIVTCVTCPCPGNCIEDPSNDCQTDSDCGPGTVCEFTFPGCTGANPTEKECIPGCRNKYDCSPGTTCQTINCITCPCPAQCL
ncbi:MAG: hypothetical protein K0V04_28315 [Deltaproteobacteria bacterium]|nr:hypothetical protein [Deltaproteobacteria bacterium]